MYKITMTKTTFALKQGTKGAYKETERETEDITETEYNYTINSCPFFRRLGGSETLTRAYTSKGYVPVKLTSISPDRETKIVREFKFTWIDRN